MIAAKAFLFFYEMSLDLHTIRVLFVNFNKMNSSDSMSIWEGM